MVHEENRAGSSEIKIPGKLLRNSIMLIICLSLQVSCAGIKPVSLAEKSLPEYVPAEHLVFIGLDGWGGAYVSRANMPTVKRMMAGGSSSLDMRCVMPSNSWPNWVALFSSTTAEQFDPEQSPSIFTLVKNAYPAEDFVFFHEWKELQKISPEAPPGTRNEDSSRNRIVEKRTIHSTPESAGLISGYIVEMKPVFTAIVFNEPDSIGHNKRWGSEAYYAKLAELDGFIGIIEQAVKDAGIYDRTVFILAADHGGTMWGHGFNSSKQRRIPIIVYGKNIKEGFTIPSPLGIYDIAPTMAAILGLEAPPEWTGLPLSGIFK